MTAGTVRLICELSGTKCRCGARKKVGNTFCGACYRWLPTALRRALYNRVGSGYEEAYAKAAAFMEARCS